MRTGRRRQLRSPLPLLFSPPSATLGVLHEDREFGVPDAFVACRTADRRLVHGVCECAPMAVQAQLGFQTQKPLLRGVTIEVQWRVMHHATGVAALFHLSSPPAHSSWLRTFLWNRGYYVYEPSLSSSLNWFCCCRIAGCACERMFARVMSSSIEGSCDRSIGQPFDRHRPAVLSLTNRAVARGPRCCCDRCQRLSHRA